MRAYGGKFPILLINMIFPEGCFYKNKILPDGPAPVAVIPVDMDIPTHVRGVHVGNMYEEES